MKIVDDIQERMGNVSRDLETLTKSQKENFEPSKHEQDIYHVSHKILLIMASTHKGTKVQPHKKFKNL